MAMTNLLFLFGGGGGVDGIFEDSSSSSVANLPLPPEDLATLLVLTRSTSVAKVISSFESYTNLFLYFLVGNEATLATV